MSELSNLQLLLKTMRPRLNDGNYVYCTLNEELPIVLNEVLMTFQEEEGLTLIIEQSIADRNKLSYYFIAAWITLTVHSALDAVGLTAAFSQALADNNISCNVVAGFHHDHIFVAASDADKAMQVLRDLS